MPRFFTFPKNNITKNNIPGNFQLLLVICSERRIRELLDLLERPPIVHRTQVRAKLPDVIWHETRHTWQQAAGLAERCQPDYLAQNVSF